MQITMRLNTSKSRAFIKIHYHPNLWLNRVGKGI